MPHTVLAVSGFDRVTAVLGVMLVLGALVAGLARRTLLSLTALFVLGGFALGQGGAKVVSFDARSGFGPGEAHRQRPAPWSCGRRGFWVRS